MMGGKSTATLTHARAGDGSAAQVLRVDGEIRGGPMFPWAGAMLLFSATPMAAIDIRPNKEVVLRLRSAVPLRLMVFATSLGRIPAVKNLDASPAWTTIAVPLSDLGLDGSDIQGMLVSGTSGTFSFEIDSVTLR
jgi:hypothetical protein